MKRHLTHAVMDQFPVLDQCLCIGGIPIYRLAARAGRTPFYAYDRQVIAQQVERLRKTLPQRIRLHYAIKANPMPAVVDLLAGIADGLDVASLGELRLALNTGIAPHLISFAGPAKSDTELAAAIADGVIINIESEREMINIARIGQKLGVRPLASVRVNPDFELKTSGMKMGGGPKPFGVDAERVPGMLKRMGALDLDFRGLQIFSGSQNLRPEAIIEAQTKTLELAIRLSAYAPAPIQWLNIGGGFGIPYFPGESRLDLRPIADNLENILAEAAPRLPGAEIVVELGRYLVGEAGVYVCEVIDRKESRGEMFLVTNGGLHHHLAASGNFGQVVRKNFPVSVARYFDERETEVVNVVGPLCTPLDILGTKVALPRSEPGDLIVVFQSGAYGYSASPHSFLSHPPPIEMLV